MDDLIVTTVVEPIRPIEYVSMSFTLTPEQLRVYHKEWLEISMSGIRLNDYVQMRIRGVLDNIMLEAQDIDDVQNFATGG